MINMKTGNLFFLLLLATLTFAGGAAKAQSGDCGASGSNCTWALSGSGDNLTLTISGTGAMKDYDPKTDSAPWSYADTCITTLAVNSGVTHIGASAFYGCTRLASLSVATSVATIGDFAFAFCGVAPTPDPIATTGKVTKLGSYAFFADSALSVTVPPTATSIGEYAFGYCQGASNTSITIPKTVTAIGSLAFNYCLSLDSVSVDTLNQYFMSENGALFNARYKQDTLIFCPPKKSGIWDVPVAVRVIGISALEQSVLGSVTIPPEATTIDKWAFSDCHSLDSIAIPAGLTTINRYAFAYCSSFDSVINRKLVPQIITQDVFLRGTTDRALSTITLIVPHSEYNTATWNMYDTAAVWKDFKLPHTIGIQFDVKVNSGAMGKVEGSLTSGLYAINIDTVITLADTSVISGDTVITVADTSVIGDTLVTLSAIPYRGYKFVGWTDGDSTAQLGDSTYYEFRLNRDTTIIAWFEPIKYNITYKLNGGVNDTLNPKTYTIATEVILRSPTRTGYNFTGWSSDSTGSDTVTIIPRGNTGDTTLWAMWKRRVNVDSVIIVPKTYDGTRSVEIDSVLFKLDDGTELHLDTTDYEISSYSFTDSTAGRRRLTVTIKLTDSALIDTCELVNGNPYQQEDSIAKKEIAIDTAYVALKIYNGTDSAHVDSVRFTGLVAGDTLKLGVDYLADSAIFLSKNAGDTTVRLYISLVDTGVTGQNYVLQRADTIYLIYHQTIVKANPDTLHLSYKLPDTLVYNGKLQPVTVNLDSSRYSGMGNITVLYNGSSTPPDTVGRYAIKVNIADGTNFNAASGLLLDTLTIIPDTISIDTVILARKI
jgi:uncharacterized repeat protein (TIGR02543 family)